jgi:Fe-S-cluster containining protein
MKGVRFECQTGCTACCEQRGQVHLTEDDAVNAAAFVGMAQAEFERRYVVRSANVLRFRKPRGKQCPFLNDGGCSIHPVKPVQCRLFPFWPELIESEFEWHATAEWCPGIGKGKLVQIAAARSIADEMKSAYPSQY